MNDIVSIRKILPFASAPEDVGADAALTCGDDFFLGGNQPSLAATEIFTTGDTEGQRGQRLLRNKSASQAKNSPVFLCVLCGEGPFRGRDRSKPRGRHCENTVIRV